MNYKYKYIFVDGTETTIEVSEEIFRILRSLDRKQKYNNEKNRTVVVKRQIDADTYEVVDIDELAVDESGEAWNALARNELEQRELKELEFEERWLEDKKEQIFKLLSEKQATVYFYRLFGKFSNVWTAKLMSITEGAVRKLLKKAEANMEKLGITNIPMSKSLILWRKVWQDKEFEYND